MTDEELHACKVGDHLILGENISFVHRNRGFTPGETVEIVKVDPRGIILPCVICKKLDGSEQSAFTARRFLEKVIPPEDWWSIWNVQ